MFNLWNDCLEFFCGQKNQKNIYCTCFIDSSERNEFSHQFLSKIKYGFGF